MRPLFKRVIHATITVQLAVVLALPDERVRYVPALKVRVASLLGER